MRSGVPGIPPDPRSSGRRRHALNLPVSSTKYDLLCALYLPEKDDLERPKKHRCCDVHAITVSTVMHKICVLCVLFW